MKTWLSNLKKTKGKLSDLKYRNWGVGTEKLSENVDEIIYGY